MEFFYRKTNIGFRVWRNDWSGDQFEVLSEEEFESFTGFCERFSLLLLEAED